MSHKIVYAAKSPPVNNHGPMARVFRALILLGVWILVGLAALVTWAKLTA